MSTKVFVGNLAFSTTDQALQELFSKVGHVKSGVIITRGRRSLGYGFVEFETVAEADRAIAEMNKQLHNKRTLKVESAKPADQQQGEKQPRQPREKVQQSPKAQKTNAATSEDGAAKKRRKNPRRKTRKPRTSTDEQTPVAVAEKPAKPQRPPRQPREKVPSKTTLYVGNLPFSYTDEQLCALFQGTNFKNAHVVTSKTGRSRGYAFVEFSTEEDQLAAMKLDKTTVEVTTDKKQDKRVISVLVSNSQGPIVVEDENQTASS
eukprot:TRINITY_DN8230_c0_g1_i1.p1 TRINITY_DN8230_c0_g1~~TRINITY_DN8230_c0_g1_i1.p1  ORF type:complete len:285 (+),score=73.52 TRINITY_DN8230_c0_g1_i1:70-855(+)